MNSIDEYLLKYKQKIDAMTIKQGPTSEEVYQDLCSYKCDYIDLESNVSEAVNFVDDTIKKYVSSYLNNAEAIDLVYVNKNKGQWLKKIDVMFNKHLPSISETIQLYLSIDSLNYSYVVTTIYQFLLHNKISFKSRLTKINRNDNFVVALYSKKDVRLLMNYINQSDLISSLNPLNPFIYQINNIGIVKDCSIISYNQYLSEIIQDYIEECILNQQPNPYTVVDLQRFVSLKYQEADNYQDKLMSYSLSIFLYGIITRDNVLNKINDVFSLKLNYDELLKYQKQLIDDEYQYYENDKSVDYDKNVYLNAQQCLYELYSFKYGKDNVKEYQLNKNIVNTMLKEIEDILNKKKCNIFVNYNDKSIHQFIPYLYGFIAQKYKFCNGDECKKIVDIIKKKIVVLDQIRDNKYYYLLDTKVIVSDIPLIKHDDGLVAIEYIDMESGLVNISVIKNGKLTTYLNVYINVDTIMLKNNRNYYGRLYRHAISDALLDFERNEKVLSDRKSDFTSCFLDDNCKEVNKYANVSIIKKIFASKIK